MISILATVDGSPESAAVVTALEKLTSDLGARVTLLTVVERPKAIPTSGDQPLVPFGGVGATPSGVTIPGIEGAGEIRWAETDDQALSRALAEGRDLLESVAGPLRDRALDVNTEIVVEEDVADAIVDFARKGGFDMIAMATHGRGGLNELVQGSVASAVVRSAVAPVLLVRPSGDR